MAIEAVSSGRALGGSLHLQECWRLSAQGLFKLKTIILSTKARSVLTVSTIEFWGEKDARCLQTRSNGWPLPIRVSIMAEEGSMIDWLF